MGNQNKNMYSEYYLNEVKQSNIFESVVAVNTEHKDEFIQTLSKIHFKPIGKDIEIIGLNFNELKEIIQGYLKINLDLPITMQIRKLRKIMSPRQGDNKHLHGLTPENIYNALINLNKPNIITRHENDFNNITIFTEIKNNEGENIIVGFTFSYTYNYKNTKVKVNNIETMYGISLENEKTYQENGKLGKRIVIYNKRSGWLVPITPTTTSNYSICKNNVIVNQNILNDPDLTEN